MKDESAKPKHLFSNIWTNESHLQNGTHLKAGRTQRKRDSSENGTHLKARLCKRRNFSGAFSAKRHNSSLSPFWTHPSLSLLKGVFAAAPSNAQGLVILLTMHSRFALITMQFGEFDLCGKMTCLAKFETWDCHVWGFKICNRERKGFFSVPWNYPLSHAIEND